MTTLRKGIAVRNTQPIKFSGGLVLEPGTGFYCTKAGKTATLAFVSPSDGNIQQFSNQTVGLEAMTAFMETSELPAALQAFFELDAPPMPALKKGTIMALGQPLQVDIDQETINVPAGTRIKIMRAGKSPRMMLRARDDLEFVEMGITAKEANALVAASPIPDNASLSRIVVKVKTFPAMTRETVALEGTITLDGKRLIVRNDGGGSPLESHDKDEGVYEALSQLLTDVLTDAGITPRPHDDIVDEYLDYALNATFGMETFAQNYQTKVNILDELYKRLD